MATDTPEVPEGFQKTETSNDNSDDYDTEWTDGPGPSELLYGALLARKPDRGEHDTTVLEMHLTQPYADHEADNLVVTLLEHRDVPKFVLIDEASTHFDARTNRREVATQWTPLAKRFAKIGVDAAGVVGHTGKDLHPEAKRLTTAAFFKLEKDVVEFYERWPASTDMPVERLFGGPVENLEPTSVNYDPDDSAPWSWNLEPELFSHDVSWAGLLDELREHGPAD